jgi:methionyl aminopeptidase
VFARHTFYKSADDIRQMIEPGLATAAALDAARQTIAVGVSTLDVDSAAERAIVKWGGASNFKLVPGYRHTVCASVNDEVVHGIPTERKLAPGDIVSIDAGAILGGWNGDAAMTVVITDETRPELVNERETLSAVTRGSLWAGIARLASARHLNELGDAIEGYIEDEGRRLGHEFGILTEYVGHGIGRSMHEDPPVYNYRVKGKGPDVKPGLVVAIEPMVTWGSPETKVLDDGWTVSTVDGLSACHWEHTVAVHADGIWVTTAVDGGAADLAAWGVTPVRPA